MDTFTFVRDRVEHQDAFRACAGPADASGAWYEDGPEFCDGEGCLTPCRLQASFHTSYSWRARPRSATCGDLHAQLIAGLGQWLDDRNADWPWINEFVPGSMEEYDGLAGLGETGAEARQWFAGTVLPAAAAAQQNPGSAHRLRPQPPTKRKERNLAQVTDGRCRRRDLGVPPR